MSEVANRDVRAPTPHSRRPVSSARSEARSCRIAQFAFSPQSRPATERTFPLALVLLALAALVHCTLVSHAGSGNAAPPAKLPPLVVEMRDRLLAAVASGRIEDLREPLEWNELPFMFRDASDGDSSADPIAYWKRISADGSGNDVLADIGRMLALPPAKLAIGRDAENSAVYVWPYLSERALEQLSPDEEKDLLSLMPAPKAASLRAGGKWTWWRLVIGADGTWHALKRDGDP